MLAEIVLDDSPGYLWILAMRRVPSFVVILALLWHPPEFLLIGLSTHRPPTQTPNDLVRVDC